MAALIEPLLAAAIVFFIGIAATRLFVHAQYDPSDIQAKMIFRLLLVPLSLAVLVLLVDGVADHLYLIRWLQPYN